MPKTKLQDAVFTALMATLMVYGMIVYNISLDLGGVSAQSFRLALNELPLMAAVAFVLEFFVVGICTYEHSSWNALEYDDWKIS